MIFNPKDDLVSGQSLHVYERLLATTDVTHAERMRVIASIQREVQQLLDYIVQLKAVEDSFMSRIGLPPSPPIGADGLPGKDMHSTLPEFAEAYRSSAAVRLGAKDFATYTKTGTQALQNYSAQDVNVAMADVLLKLRNEDRFARRLSHKIMSARLAADMKVERLLKILEEQQAVLKGKEA